MKIRICVLWHWKVHNTKKWYALIRVIQIIMEYNDSQYYAWICLKGSSGPSEPSAQKKTWWIPLVAWINRYGNWQLTFSLYKSKCLGKWSKFAKNSSATHLPFPCPARFLEHWKNVLKAHHFVAATQLDPPENEPCHSPQKQECHYDSTCHTGAVEQRDQ